jgi:hypothetical protein
VEAPSDNRDENRDDRHLELAAKIAHWADHRFIDPIVGLILPGAGDLLGAVIGLHAVGLGLARRAPKVVIARMLLNLSVDMALGLVPLVGDLFDFGFRAHSKNIELLRARSASGPVKASAADWLLVGLALLLFLAILALPFVLLAQLID